MGMKMKDEKQPRENAEIVKEKENPKRNYIFKKNGVTKVGFFIILAILVLVAIGVLLSGLFFETPMTP